jgi:hypothetical protein
VSSQVDASVLKKRAVSIFRAEDDSVENETTFMGKRSAQFRVTTIAQQSFDVTMCDFQFKRWHFRRNRDFQFYETGFVCLVSCVWSA